MDISTNLNITLTWFAGRLAWLSRAARLHAAAATVPALLALVTRDLLAALCRIAGGRRRLAPRHGDGALTALAVAAGVLLALSDSGAHKSCNSQRMAELRGRLNQLEAPASSWWRRGTRRRRQAPGMRSPTMRTIAHGAAKLLTALPII
jgi:hypothetical protein